MALNEVQDIVLVIILVLAAALFYCFVKFWLPKLMRRRLASRTGESAWRDDRAYNAIQAAKGLLSFLEAEGLAVPQAEVLLHRAETKFELKMYDEAATLAKQATEMMAAMRRSAKKATGSVEYKSDQSGSSVPVLPNADGAPSEPTPRVYRDLSRRVGEADPDSTTAPTTVRASASSPLSSNPVEPDDGAGMDAEGQPGTAGDDEEPPLKAAARKLPKNFMESRFMLTTLQNDLNSASEDRRDSVEGKEAQDWAKKSQSAFDRKDYDESLRLALRGRRRFGGAGMSTISVGPGTVVEAPPNEVVPSAQRSSAPVGSVASSSENTTCSRCGRSNSPGDRFCRGCGAPMAQAKCPRCQRPTEPEDKFCHGCGAPLTTPI